MIKGVFFDAAGVFYDRKETTGALARRRLAELGYPVELSPEQQALKTKLHRQATVGDISHAAYWDQLVLMHGVQEVALRARLCEEFCAQSFQVFPYPGGSAAMAGLAARGFVLGIITDTIYPVEWKMAWLEKVGVARFIKIVTSSTVLRAHKPQPEMYLDALRQAHLTVEQAVFVGHDAIELTGAQSVGMTTVAVNYDPLARADYYASSLLGLLDVPVLQRSE